MLLKAHGFLEHPLEQVSHALDVVAENVQALDVSADLPQMLIIDTHADRVRRIRFGARAIGEELGPGPALPARIDAHQPPGKQALPDQHQRGG
ncbi:MAG TPA: hypothetical protein VEX86_08245 [Longimicrobium sp.]|nr:hypothetical protein [Longimicrobium sp.]